MMPSDSSIRKKEDEKMMKYQDLKDELKRVWKVKAKVLVPVVIGAHGALTHKL